MAAGDTTQVAFQRELTRVSQQILEMYLKIQQFRNRPEKRQDIENLEAAKKILCREIINLEIKLQMKSCLQEGMSSTELGGYEGVGTASPGLILEKSFNEPLNASS